MTLVLFNHEYHLIHNGTDLELIEPLDESTYRPGGMTALLDAVGRAIDDVKARIAQMKKNARPAKVIFAILTDGLENASTDYSREKVFKTIEAQQKKQKWEFIFLAANQDAVAAGEMIGIQAQDAMAFKATKAGIREAYRNLSMSTLDRRKR
jgi:hypothetical protein